MSTIAETFKTIGMRRTGTTYTMDRAHDQGCIEIDENLKAGQQKGMQKNEYQVRQIGERLLCLLKADSRKH